MQRAQRLGMKHFLFIAALAALSSAAAQSIENAEVRLPYAELRRLLDERSSPDRPEAPPPALMSSRLRVSSENGRTIIDATFRTTRFAGGWSWVPLIGGPVGLESAEPADLSLVVRGGQICHAAAEAGQTSFSARFIADTSGAPLVLPPSASIVLEAEGGAFTVTVDGREHSLQPGRPLPLPAAGANVILQPLSTAEIEARERPPEPSDWTWQHQALVWDREGELDHLVIARASATAGSGLSAELVFPPDARDLTTTGEDLVAARVARDAGGNIRLLLEWRTRDLLERELAISYRRPLRPLDTTWQLAAPQGEREASASRTRFLIAANPRRAFEGEGLAGPFDPAGLPSRLREALSGSTYFTLESPVATAALGAKELPLVATAEAVIPDATWSVRQESDGSLLAEGTLKIEHRQPLRAAFECPEGFTLLACTVGGRDTRPVDRGEGRIEIPLPPPDGSVTEVRLSFTAAATALDPVSGTLELALPRTPLFIRTLQWRIDLPAAYRSEIHGNLTRENLIESDPPSAIRLRKNLCRDEAPAVSVFYQRADLTERP